jgi:hypothetical protein
MDLICVGRAKNEMFSTFPKQQLDNRHRPRPVHFRQTIITSAFQEFNLLGNSCLNFYHQSIKHKHNAINTTCMHMHACRFAAARGHITHVTRYHNYDIVYNRVIASPLFLNTCIRGVHKAHGRREMGFLGACPQTPWVRFADFGLKSGFCVTLILIGYSEQEAKVSLKRQLN